MSLTKSPISARCHFPHHERGREGHKEREGESPNQFRRRRGNLSSAIPAVRPYFSLLRVSFSAKAKAKTNETSRPTGSIDSLSLPQFGCSYSILNPRSPYIYGTGGCQLSTILFLLDHPLTHTDSCEAAINHGQLYIQNQSR